MKSLWEFLDDDDDQDEDLLKDKIEQRSEHLTRGAWQVVKQVLQRKNDYIDGDTSRTYEPVHTEFGLVPAAVIVDKIEQKKSNEITSTGTTTTVTVPTESAAVAIN